MGETQRTFHQQITFPQKSKVQKLNSVNNRFKFNSIITKHGSTSELQ